jgi:predicted metal-dependent phosphoesterase TrpH
LIDLHTHTTASDGRCSPEELVARASASGVTVLGVTDHDTVAACERAARACLTCGIAFVPGIEITAVCEELDVHILGYFIDARSGGLQAFLTDQRLRRIERIRRMVARLAEHGVVLDADAILRPGLENATRAVGRPWIARALVAGGHVANAGEAFDRWLSRGRPAFVPRTGASPLDVVARIHEAGGVASLAHPALIHRDQWIDSLAAGGLDAIEAYHIDHDADATARYLDQAARLGLAVSGGSDYHADDSHGGAGPGAISLPREHYDRLVLLGAQRAGRSSARISS